MRKIGPPAAKYLTNAAWIVAFVALCTGWVFEVVRANYRSQASGNEVWVCPIAGKCGPPGTPGIGKW